VTLDELVESVARLCSDWDEQSHNEVLWYHRRDARRAVQAVQDDLLLASVLRKYIASDQYLFGVGTRTRPPLGVTFDGSVAITTEEADALNRVMGAAS
jgi:hypothetical protein